MPGQNKNQRSKSKWCTGTGMNMFIGGGNPTHPCPVNSSIAPPIWCICISIKILWPDGSPDNRIIYLINFYFTRRINYNMLKITDKNRNVCNRV